MGKTKQKPKNCQNWRKKKNGSHSFRKTKTCSKTCKTKTWNTQKSQKEESRIRSRFDEHEINSILLIYSSYPFQIFQFLLPVLLSFLHKFSLFFLFCAQTF